MTHFKILFQIVLLIFLLNNSLFSKDNKLEFLQKKNSFIYISADSIKSFYKNENYVSNLINLRLKNT